MSACPVYKLIATSSRSTFSTSRASVGARNVMPSPILLGPQDRCVFELRNPPRSAPWFAVSRKLVCSHTGAGSPAGRTNHYADRAWWRTRDHRTAGTIPLPTAQFGRLRSIPPRSQGHSQRPNWPVLSMYRVGPSDSQNSANGSLADGWDRAASRRYAGLDRRWPFHEGP